MMVTSAQVFVQVCVRNVPLCLDFADQYCHKATQPSLRLAGLGDPSNCKCSPGPRRARLTSAQGQSRRFEANLKASVQERCSDLFAGGQTLPQRRRSKWKRNDPPWDRIQPAVGVGK
jgi:hypothetical protein